MLIKKSESIKFQNSNNCTVWEYDFPSKKFGLTTSFINGRYPEEGKGVNLECQQIFFVISGSGTIYSDKGEFKIENGDSYLFEENEPYYIEGNNLSIIIINAPKWQKEQYKKI